MRVSTASRSSERGDTLIEVLFAVSVFAMIAVGALTIMNQGTATAQRSLEITLVRQQMHAQAEALRYVHAAYVTSYQAGSTNLTGPAAEWAKIRSTYAVGAASKYGEVASDKSSCLATVPGTAPFVMNARTAKIADEGPMMVAREGESMPPFAQVAYDPANPLAIKQAYGLWIEADPRGREESAGYIDFHIRACWESPGAGLPMTLGTIVRLYDPTI